MLAQRWGVGRVICSSLPAQSFRRSGWILSDAFRHGADVDLTIRIAELGRTVYLNEPLLLRRLHDHNLTWHNLAAGHISRERVLRFERHKGRYAFTHQDLVRFRAYLVACAAYDVLRVFKHKSLEVTAYAIRQMARYWDFQPAVYLSLLTEIITGRNRDRR